MALYAIGDVQGCFRPLQALLAKIDFSPRKDTLWFTGDLVNRGPQSLEVLRFIAGLGERAVAVLGNHDLHLLAVAAGLATTRPRDTLAPILAAPDRDALLHWLRHRPLLHVDTTHNIAIVHAGLVPQWDIAQARALAAEAEAIFRGPGYQNFFAHMYGDTPDRWDPGFSGYERLRFIVNVCTRLRFCDRDGRLDLLHKGAPGTQAPSLIPWFQAPARRNRATRIVFGHWSTLGFYAGDGVLGLDTGCVWDGRLTAVRLDADGANAITVPCPG